MRISDVKMSKKQSEDQKKSNHKLCDSHFGQRRHEITNSEEESLEVRLFRLIRGELQRTRGENEFVSLENRIIRILRNEFITDIMREINTADDEIASWFNRFLRSVPELSDIYCSVSAESCKTGHIVQKEKEKDGGKKNNNTARTSPSNDRTSASTLCTDERTMRHILEMFRAPIQITCRACDDMRRVIRAGRRMIREIQLLAAVRSDIQSMRRVEMKCIDELDQLGTPRPGRTAVTIGSWRQILRRRCRNMNPPQPRERNWYYLVFGRLDKPKLVPRMASTTKQMMLKVKKLQLWKISPFKTRLDKQLKKTWNETTAKAEINNIISFFRRFRLRSGHTFTSHQCTPDCNDLEGDSLLSDERNREISCSLVTLNDSDVTDNNVTQVIYTSCGSSAEAPNLITTSSSRENYASGLRPSQYVSLLDVSPTDTTAPSTVTSSPFSVSFNTGTASPQDITIVLYTDRVLEVSVSQRLPCGDSTLRQRRWMLPESVIIDNLRCILEKDLLVISESSMESEILIHHGPETTILGPPIRQHLPSPRQQQ